MRDPYREVLYWPRWFYVLLVLIFLGIPVAAMFYESEGSPYWALLPMGVGFVVLWLYGRMEFRVDADGVHYGFRTASNFVPWARIDSVQPERYVFLRYGGWGWRIGGRRNRAYSLIGYPRGIRVKFPRRARARLVGVPLERRPGGRLRRRAENRPELLMHA